MTGKINLVGTRKKKSIILIKGLDLGPCLLGQVGIIQILVEIAFPLDMHFRGSKRRHCLIDGTRQRQLCQIELAGKMLQKIRSSSSKQTSVMHKLKEQMTGKTNPDGNKEEEVNCPHQRSGFKTMPSGPFKIPIRFGLFKSQWKLHSLLKCTSGVPKEGFV